MFNFQQVKALLVPRLRHLVRRVRNILLEPRNEWPLIATEPGGVRPLLFYVAILALIPALCGYLASAHIGTEVSAGRFHEELPPAVIRAIISYLFSFAIVYLTALAANALAPLFGGTRSFIHALKLTVYSYTPVWLIGVVLFVPGLRFLTLFGLYALRLIWTGLPPLMGADRRRVIHYTGAIAVIAFGIVLALAIVQSAIMVVLYG